MHLFGCNIIISLRVLPAESHRKVVGFEQLADPGFVLPMGQVFPFFLAILNILLDSFFFLALSHEWTVALHVIIGATSVREVFATSIVTVDSLFGVVMASVDFDRVLRYASEAALFGALERQPCKYTAADDIIRPEGERETHAYTPKLPFELAEQCFQLHR